MIVIPRTSLAELAGRDDAAPLDPGIRTFMETRLRADLSDVRIHTTTMASRLCASARARAMTMGNDILFADGAYALRTAEGVRLLAHELIHVLQQRAAVGQGRAPAIQSESLTVGDEFDAVEREADLLANEALEAGLRSRVTPDGGGSIRRAIQVLEGTAQLDLKYKGATPGISYRNAGGVSAATAVLHLTRNAKLIALDAVQLGSAVDSSAMRIRGTVQVLAAPQDTASDINATWSFHMIQAFLELGNIARYAGETPTDGSMKLDFAGAGNYAGYGKFVVDADADNPATIPYAEQYSNLTNISPKSGIWLATVTFDDHPFFTYPLVRKNGATAGKNNFLYWVGRQFDVITTLVAVDQKLGLIYPLVHVEWAAFCQGTLRWYLQSGIHMVDPAVVTGSSFVVGPVTLGAPKSASVGSLITNPTRDPDKMFNRLSERAQLSVLNTDVNSQDVEVLDKWSTFVPDSHFK